jgi:uncharacterized membrane protein YgaE (UPF0421/DUF939 family)
MPDRNHSTKLPAWLFTLKCVLGVGICYSIYKMWPGYPFNWAIISVVIGLSFDNTHKHAIDRIIANILGCFVGLIMYIIPLPYLFQLFVGITLIILIGCKFNIADTIRSALAAFLIVTLQNKNSDLWLLPIERVLCVMTGCLVALLLNIFFNIILTKRRSRVPAG